MEGIFFLNGKFWGTFGILKFYIFIYFILINKNNINILKKNIYSYPELELRKFSWHCGDLLFE
jgi:hypothetical protein